MLAKCQISLSFSLFLSLFFSILRAHEPLDNLKPRLIGTLLIVPYASDARRVVPLINSPLDCT